MRQYDGTIFTTELPGRPAPDTPSSRGRMGVPMTPGGANPAARRSTFNDAPANTRGLTGQKAKVRFVEINAVQCEIPTRMS